MTDSGHPHAARGLAPWLILGGVMLLGVALAALPFLRRKPPAASDASGTAVAMENIAGAPQGSNAPSSLVAALAPEHAPQRGLLLTARDEQTEIARIAPTAAFYVGTEESLDPRLQPQFSARFEGALRIPVGGLHRFRAGSGARVYLGEVEVSSAGLQLPSGWVALRVEVNRVAGPFTLRLEWSGPSFSWEAVPATACAHFDRAESFEQHLQVAVGRAAFEDLGCANCHATQDPSIAHLSAPDLTHIGARAGADWIYRWLADPLQHRSDTTMPALRLDASERRDIAAYLARLGGPLTTARDAALVADHDLMQQGAEEFSRLGCASCHSTSHLALRDLGSKTNVDALTKYLLDPLAVDPSGRMPAFFGEPGRDPAEEEARARAIATWLTADPASQNATPQASMPAGAPDRQRGEQLIAARGCLACHALQPSPDVRAIALGLSDSAHAATIAHEWRALGPFRIEANTFEDALPPELDHFAATEYANADAQLVSWRNGSAFEDGKVHTIHPELDHAVLYLERELRAEADALLILDLRCDDFFTLWLDDERVHSSLANSLAAPVHIERQLSAGIHKLRWKLGDRSGNWRFRCDLRLLSGRVVAPLVDRAIAPATQALDPERGCLSSAADAPGPRYALDANRRAALQAFLRAQAWTTTPTKAPTHAVRRAIERHGCESCHTPLGAAPAPGLEETPPPLELAGEKLRASAIEAIFAERSRVRSYLSVRMPHFGPELGKTMAEGLAAERGVVPGAGIEPPRATLAESAKGIERLGTGDRNFACTSCHDYKSAVALGERGPGLTTMHRRIRPEWFSAWLREPSRIRPGTSMPAFMFGRSASEAESITRELWSALAMEDALPPPPGLSSSSTSGAEAPTQRPLHYRCFLPDSTASSFAVALPGLFSYVWDPLHCRLRYAWIGDFLDMRPQWKFKGETFPTLLGEVFYRPGLEHGLEIDGLEDGVRYRGYRLEHDVPTFLWKLGDIDVAERITATPDGAGLLIEFRCSTAVRTLAWIVPTVPHVQFKSADGVEVNGRIVARDANAKTLRIEIRPEEGR